MEKVCNVCLESKDVTEFYKKEGSKDGLRHACKQCTRDKVKKYKSLNKDKVSESNRKYRESHKDYYKQYGAKYRSNVKNNDTVIEHNPTLVASDVD